MSLEDLPAASQLKKDKKLKKKKQDEAMDVLAHVDSQELGGTTKKRKADSVPEGDDENISKKERERLRKLIKERTADEVPVGLNATPTEEDLAKQERRENKKEKKRKLAKERTADEVPVELNTTPTEEHLAKQERRENKKEKKRKRKEQV
jgi:hypothetical protein